MGSKLAIFLIALLIPFFTFNAFSQGQPCKPDHPEVDWEGPISLVIFTNCPPPDGPDCDIHYTYWWRVIRDNNDEIISREVQVTVLWTEGDCSACDVETKILKSIWQSRRMRDTFEISPNDSCYTDFRVTQGPCWEEDDLYYPPIYSSCPSVECCWARYEICYYQKQGCGAQRIKSITLLESWDPEIECESPCFGGMCDEWIVNTSYFPKNNDYHHILFDNNTSSSNSKIKPNPSDGGFEIVYQSKQKSDNITLIIFNSLGEKIINKVFKKNSQEIIMSLDFSSFNNGVYYYQILDKTNLLSKGQFTIIK
jgi:hypothetical protein